MAIEIVNFPINSMVIFHSKMLIYQRVNQVNCGKNHLLGYRLTKGTPLAVPLSALRLRCLRSGGQCQRERAPPNGSVHRDLKNRWFIGLVCWGKSEPETMVFTCFYHQIDRAFRLKFSHHPILWLVDCQNRNIKLFCGKIAIHFWISPDKMAKKGLTQLRFVKKRTLPSHGTYTKSFTSSRAPKVIHGNPKKSLRCIYIYIYIYVILSYHIIDILYHIISYYIILYHIILYYIILYYIILY